MTKEREWKELFLPTSYTIGRNTQSCICLVDLPGHSHRSIYLSFFLFPMAKTSQIPLLGNHLTTFWSWSPATQQQQPRGKHGVIHACGAPPAGWGEARGCLFSRKLQFLTSAGRSQGGSCRGEGDDSTSRASAAPSGRGTVGGAGWRDGYATKDLQICCLCKTHQCVVKFALFSQQDVGFGNCWCKVNCASNSFYLTLKSYFMWMRIKSFFSPHTGG